MLMAASYLVSCAQWIAGIISEKVITSKLNEWVSQFSDLGGDVGLLKEQMSYIKTVLSLSQRRRIQDAHLTTLVARLHQLFHEADDVLDELDYHRIQQEVERRQPTQVATTNLVATPSATSSLSLHLLGDVASHQLLGSTMFRGLYRLGRRKQRKLASTADAGASAQPPKELDRNALRQQIRKVTDQLRSVGEQVCKALQLEQLETIGQAAHSGLENPRLTTSYPASELKMFGRNDQMDSIIEVLTDHRCRGQSPLSVLPVVGNGGIGKTTFLQHVYHDNRIQSFFHIRMWICVPHNFDVVRLTNDMLEAATGEKQHRGSENLDILQAKLEKRLQGRRFLLVLDDLWTIQKNKWDLLLAPLRWIEAMMDKSTILVTTRDRRVAELVGTMPPIDLCGLEGEAFLDCFRANIFGDEKHNGHQHLRPIGREIARKLNGYPLAAKSVGALLRKDLSIEHWNRILESRVWEPQNATDGIMSILRLSYEYLPFHLKRCFSYCSLFPKGYRFCERDLVHIWDSQGFLDPRHDRKPEEVGHVYLNDLVSLGFFQKVVHAAHHPTWYLIHDLIHDLALDVSSDYCLTIDRIPKLKICPSETICHLSIITESIYHEDIHGNIERSEDIEKVVTMVASLLKMRYLRSLMLFGKYDCHFAHVFRRAFREATKMRSIIMCMVPFHEGSLLYDLGQFIHLRYIRIIADDHVHFPESLGRLHHLQVLDVGGSTGDLQTNVYNGLASPVCLAKHIVLTSLHSLYLDNCKGCKTLPAFLQFPALKKLHLIGIPSMTELLTASLEELILSDMPELQTWTVTKKQQQIDDLQLIEINNCPKLRDIHLSPSCNSDAVNYRKLRSVVIKNCSCMMPLPPVPVSPKIKILIENVQSFPCKRMSYTADANPCLLLMGMAELGVLDETVVSFENLLTLQMLSIDRCPNLNSFSWEGFHQLSALKDLTIYRCPKLLSMPMTEGEQEHAKGLLPSLERLEIWSCGITGKNLSCLLSNLPHLSFLKLKECPEITRLVVDQQADQESSALLPDNAPIDGLLHIQPHSLPSLQELCFDSCPTVCENSEGLRGLVTLSKLEICECPRFLSYLVFENDGMHHVEGTCLIPSSLQELKIASGEWKSMSLHGLTAMRRLSIHYSEVEVLDLESCIELNYAEFHCCPELSTLHGLQSCVQLRRLKVLLTPGFWRAWDHVSLQAPKQSAAVTVSLP